jgi:hypothetical protein
MIRTIRRTVPRPMYIRLPPFCRLLPFPCFGREKTSHFSAGSSAQKQSLGVFNDPQHRQEHVDQSRERDREHRDERAAPGRDHGRDRRRNGHPPDRKRYSGVDQGPAEIGRPEPLKTKVQPGRDGGRCRGEGNQKETHVVSTKRTRMGLRLPVSRDRRADPRRATHLCTQRTPPVRQESRPFWTLSKREPRRGRGCGHLAAAAPSFPYPDLPPSSPRR